MARSRSTLVLLAALTLLAGAFAWAAPRALAPIHRSASLELTYVPEGRALRALGPGLKVSIADYFWLLTVQYIGDQTVRRGGFDQVYPLVDFVTDLDPQHGYAYQTAGIVLSAAGRIDESDLILKKGIERGPNWWTYPYYLAFNSFFYRRDYATAADWAEQAARRPGASANVSHLALALKSKSGRPEDAILLLEELRATANDDATSTALEEQYRLAVLQRDFAFLDAAVDQYREQHGRLPRDLRELVMAGIIDAVPPEPFGGEYELRDDGRVHGTNKDFRFKPPETTQRWSPPSFTTPRGGRDTPFP